LDNMQTRPLIMIATVGVALLAASHARAQINYLNEDVLLDFRNTTDTSGADVTVDLGQVSAFAALTAVTALDTVSNNGYVPLFTESELTNAFGGPLDGVGFTVAAVDSVSDTTWITRVQAGTTQPTYTSAQPSHANATTIANQIGLVAQGASGFDGTIVIPFGTDGVIVASGQNLSYQTQATPANQPANLNFRGEITAAGAGGPLESVTTGNTVYSAFWEVPYSGQGLTNTYLGYFTFNGATGELDFTPANAVVVTPPTLACTLGTSNSVIVAWTNTGSFTLQQNSSLAAGGWTNSSQSLTTNGSGLVSATITPSAGSLFFRLASQ
jgi:hypothetical protein